MGTAVMDRNNRIGRRERREILKSTQGLSEGLVAIDKGQVEPLRLNTILQALEARRKHRSPLSRRPYLVGLPRPVLG
jgi:hypothetical protein